MDDDPARCPSAKAAPKAPVTVAYYQARRISHPVRREERGDERRDALDDRRGVAR